MKLTKNDCITIVGRRWFEKTNGNTYHSCEVYLNGDFVAKNPFEYGYGDGYIQTAGDLIINHILKEDYNNNDYDNHYLIVGQLEKQGVKVVRSVSDVERKKYL